MSRLYVLLVSILLSSVMLCAQFAQASDPLLIMKTSLGEVWIQLNPGKAPVTVEHFLSYVDDNYYDGVIFHRVIPGFMIQAGGYAADMQAKETQGTIVNEAHNGLKNLIGTLSMARTSDPDSADAQFFINTSNNSSLDKSHSNPGYAVFGKVIQGMSVVGEIELVDTGIKNSMAAVPVEPVVIISLRRAD